MNTIFAIDASSKSSGYAYFDENNNLQYGCITATNSWKAEKRIIKIRNDIIKILSNLPYIETIVLEDTQGRTMGGRAAQVLNWLQGVLTIAFYELNPKLQIEYIAPTSWRSKLKIQHPGIKRDQQKILDIKCINDLYNLSITNDDIADAIGILTAYKNDQTKSFFNKPLW